MIIVACITHPTYKAKNQPRCKCAACWAMWALLNHDPIGAYATTGLRITQP